MDQLTLYHALQLRRPAVVSFFGAGGKTSLMLKLAGELADNKLKTVITTTTKIYPPANLPLILASDTMPALKEINQCLKQSDIVVLGSSISADEKLKGIEPEMVSEIQNSLESFVLVEADGANRKPLKGFNRYEPVLPKDSNHVLAVVGADALGKMINETIVHRLNMFSVATGLNKGESITVSTLERIYRYMLEAGEPQAPEAIFTAVLNKVDLLSKPEEVALNLSAAMAKCGSAYRNLLLTTTAEADPVKFLISTDSKPVRVKVAAIILAAGRSERMGEDKLNLKLGGITVFEHTLKAVLKAGADQIIIVVRPDSTLSGLAEKEQCRIVVNPAPETGLSSSLKVGLSAVDDTCQGVLFALGDQPLTPVTVYRALIKSYRNTLKKITCPLFEGRRGNPTIFDRRTWPELLLLEGDQGGRSLIDQSAEDQIEYLAVDNPAVVADLDTPEDYILFQRAFTRMEHS